DMESLSPRAINKEISEPTKALTIMPAKIIVSIAKLRLLNRTKPKTTNKVTNPLTIDTTGSVQFPKPSIFTWKNITITAPDEAPEETPIVYGSAKGLRNNP